MKTTFYILIGVLLLQFNMFSQISGWTLVNSGTTENLNAVHSQLNLIFACGDSGTILKSLDSGKTWQSVLSPTSVDLNDIYVGPSGNAVIAVGDSGIIIRTTDEGYNWEIINSGVTDDLFSVDFYDGTGLIGGRSQTVLRCFIDWGLTWEVIQTGLLGGGFWGTSIITHNNGFVGGENSIFQALLGRTSDTGENWEFLPFYLNSNEGKLTDIDFLYWGADIGFATSQLWDGRGAISKTTDEGGSWITKIFNNSLNAIDFQWTDPLTKGYAVGDLGLVLKTSDLGETWQQQQSGTNVNLNDVHVFWWYTDAVIAIGENGIILMTTNGGEPVGITEEETYQLNNFELAQNNPNPFNPFTKIKYSLPEEIFVRLIVYDMLGRQVAVVVNEKKVAGAYETEFTASELPSGIYFYQLKAGNYIETKKMVLIK